MSTEPILLNDDEVSRFITEGYLILQSDAEPDLHTRIDRRLREVAQHESWPGNNVLPRVPELHGILKSPRVHGAVASLLGDDYMLHPHRAIHRSSPIDDPDLQLDDAADAPPMGKDSTAGSAWHQDAQSPLARARHHLPRFLIGFYFPHHTPHAMGPTRIQAGSYLLPQPPERPTGIVVPQHIAAGTFMLVHFDMVHAGFSNRADQDRYMLKFVFSRMSNPTAPSWNNKSAVWKAPSNTPAPEINHAWRFIWQWMRGEQPALSERAAPGRRSDGTSAEDLAAGVNRLYLQTPPEQLADQLRAKAGQNRHTRRIAPPHKGKQYVKDDIEGYPRRWNERAIVYEPETYALTAQGPRALDALLSVAACEDPWLNCNVAFGLGEIGILDERVAHTLDQFLGSEHEQLVRQSIDAVAFLDTNADPFLEHFEHLMRVQHSRWQQKAVERGWVPQDQIRLNVMFACVALLSTDTNSTRLEALLKQGLEDQGYCAQVAVEGLTRIGSRDALDAALRYTTERAWDDTLLGLGKSY